MKYFLIICFCILCDCCGGKDNEPAASSQKGSVTNTTKSDSDKIVGLAYTTWFTSTPWTNVWGTPELGFYTSNDTTVIKQHGEWLADAGVDFIFIDWSNDLGYIPGVTVNRPDFDMIENSVPIIFKEWAKIKGAPKISIMLGCPDHPEAFSDGTMQRKIDQVYSQYIDNKADSSQYFKYLGKPLLIIYIGTPSPFENGIPDFQDSRFTIRYMTGFITEQPNLLSGNNRLSKYGYWSWEDRGDQTYTLLDGQPEACTVSAASRADSVNSIPAIGRDNGLTFQSRWSRAENLNVKIVLVTTWNEWITSEQPSAEVSKDLEPSVEFGHFYLNLLKSEIVSFKNTH
jgi:hypothetical protein